MGAGSFIGALVFGLVPLVVLLILIYRLAQIAENTGRIADALEYQIRMDQERDVREERAAAESRRAESRRAESAESGRDRGGD
jgi:hypothetical protein